MAMNGLRGVLNCLTQKSGEIHVDAAIRAKALACIERMLDFTQRYPVSAPQGLVPNIGAA
jgi:quinolinate synthase